MKKGHCLGAGGDAESSGKDAFHRVPDYTAKEWDAVERVLTETVANEP